jgi:hypothetical protein
MFAGQFKSGPLMVEPGFIPASGVVTCRAPIRNPFCKLITVDVFVAGFTCHQFLPPEDPHLFPSGRVFRVAPVARDSCMSIRELEAGL